jgi:hypothetical protein
MESRHAFWIDADDILDLLGARIQTTYGYMTEVLPPVLGAYVKEI